MISPRFSMIACLLAVSAAAQAQSPALQLGERTRGMYDVSFRPFGGADKVEPKVKGEQLRFEKADKRWTLTFERAELSSPISLFDTRDLKGNTQAGYLTAIVNNIRSSNGQAEVLTSEPLDMGTLRIGLITVSSRVQDQPILVQRAVIEVSPKLYYAVAMTSPAPEKDIESDAGVQEAVGMFRAIVDSIESVDLSKVRIDQEDRLLRTRALFLEWKPEKLKSVLQPEQMLRFRKNGKDIGYAYIVQQLADALPRDGEMDRASTIDPQKATGLRIGTRLRTVDEDKKTINHESWAFVTLTRQNEVWSNVTVVRDPSAPTEQLKETWASEVGASDVQKERVFEKEMAAQDFKNADAKNEMPFRLVDRYKLTVRSEQRSAVAQPIERELPPFYLPQALVTLLPRLLPLNVPTGYLFASYQSDSRQVMFRYVDVGRETDVRLDGRTERAVPVIERLGLEGTPTTHYFSLDTRYLGSINAESGIETTPTDTATLQAIWKDINIAAPGAVKGAVGAQTPPRNDNNN